MTATFDWSGRSGDTWAALWPRIDRALAELAAPLDSAVLEAAPAGSFDALDIGCGAGTTALALASARSDARILCCDLSPALVEVGRSRSTGLPGLRFEVKDAVEAAIADRPFDLFLSRHGVMFFADPVEAFATFRASARNGAKLVFSCFRGWEENPWASELAGAAAGRELPPPGREPSGFAFADPSYVREILETAGWACAEPRQVDFTYVAGEGDDCVGQAMALLTQVGPASAVLREIPDRGREAAVGRMRAALAARRRRDRLAFPAAAWIWTASASADA